jgi:hypothetical protein
MLRNAADALSSTANDRPGPTSSNLRVALAQTSAVIRKLAHYYYGRAISMIAAGKFAKVWEFTRVHNLRQSLKVGLITWASVEILLHIRHRVRQ